MKDRAARIEVLEHQHRELDKAIKVAYNSYAPDESVEQLKRKKLTVKDEIENIKEEQNHGYKD